MQTLLVLVVENRQQQIQVSQLVVVKLQFTSIHAPKFVNESYKDLKKFFLFE